MKRSQWLVPVVVAAAFILGAFINAALKPTLEISRNTPSSPAAINDKNEHGPENQDGKQIHAEGSLIGLWREFTSGDAEAAIAVATAALVMVTAGLWFSTFQMWRATLTAARAAKDGAEALPLIERARVYVVIDPGHQSNFNSGILTAFLMNGGGAPVFDFKITNAGKTPALISHVCAGAQAGLAADPPGYETPCTTAEFPLMSEESRSVTPWGIAISPQLTAQMRQQVMSGTLTLRFYVYVEYGDVLGDRHETRWYWIYNPTTRYLEPTNAAGDQYNHQG